MYQKEYDKTLEYIKNSVDFVKDYRNMTRCEQMIQHFTREEAWRCLQDMIREYWTEIEVFGSLWDGSIIYRNVNPITLSDSELRGQLTYIGRHIPIYILIRKGESELAKKICQWIDKR